MSNSTTNAFGLLRSLNKDKYPIIWIGCGLGALFWIYESFLHVFVLDDGSLTGQIFTPDPHEIYKRLLFAVTLVLFSVFAQAALTRLKKLKDDLSQQEKEFYHILDNNPVGIMLVDTESRRVSWANRNSLKLIGSSKEQIAGKICHNHLCPAEEGNCPILDGGQSMDLTERTLITGEGKEIPIFKIVQRVTFKGKNHLLEAFFDLTERKQMETALQLANAELNQIFQTASVGMRVIDEEFEILRMNRTLEDMCGVTTEEAVGRKCYDIFSGEACFTPRCPIKRIFNGDRHISSVTSKNRLDGKAIPCILSATPFVGPDGNIVGIVESFKDISQVTKAQNAILAERERLKRILANLDLGVGILNSEYQIEYQNAILTSQFGTVEGRCCYEIIHHRSEPCDDCLMDSAFRSGNVQKLEFNSSKEKFYRCVYTPFTDIDGGKKALMVFEDVTEQRLATVSMMRAEQLASLGEMAASVAHEINNPIGSIINYGQMIVNKSAVDDRINRIASLVVKEGDRIAGIVEGMLSFSRSNDRNKKHTAVQTLVRDALALCSTMLRKDDIHIAVSMPEKSMMIYAQPQEIEQVIINLISNSRHALNLRHASTSRSKRISISAKTIRSRPEPCIQICFFDNGAGIAPAIIQKVMNPFFTSKSERQHTGLGLSISNNIIKSHGGLMRIASREGICTKVFIELPEYEKP